jgi:hypothetical protein
MTGAIRPRRAEAVSADNREAMTQPGSFAVFSTANGHAQAPVRILLGRRQGQDDGVAASRVPGGEPGRSERAKLRRIA